jgi:hypothetical protein
MDTTNLIEKYPTTAATIIPIKKVKKYSDLMLFKFLMSKIKAPNIAGNDNIKENFAEASGLHPVRRPAVMVIPDLDTPGKTAIP